ncbi:MAG: DUF4922 domain-containing protein [Chitinivibrionales bacterium]|nr:DUF4922 domain-containing protein [Chitinivibrionales bacterium]
MKQNSIETKFLYRYTGKDDHTETLGPLLYKLYEQQYQTWPLLAANYDGLRQVCMRTIVCSGYEVNVQCNPRRRKNIVADVDEKTIRQRPCFLCSHNLPLEQRAILYREELLLLCNPYPIFPFHFTFNSLLHTPQQFAVNCGHMLNLTRSTAGAFSVFYNGPQCGASAPDHFHFQAVPSRTLPLENLADQPSRRETVVETDTLSVSLLKNIGRACFVIESSDDHIMHDCIGTFIHILRTIEQTKEEPMLNVTCTFTDNQYRMLLFPRGQHRPGLFFAEGEKRRTISPASVDMCGILITPDKNDFDHLTSQDVESIFSDVSIPQQTIDRICTELNVLN